MLERHDPHLVPAWQRADTSLRLAAPAARASSITEPETRLQWQMIISVALGDSSMADSQGRPVGDQAGGEAEAYRDGDAVAVADTEHLSPGMPVVEGDPHFLESPHSRGQDVNPVRSETHTYEFRLA